MPGIDENVELEDTASSFPELPEAVAGQLESSGQISQVTHPVASTTEETYPDLPVAPGESSESLSVWGPLGVLVLFPAAIVTSILLIWWASRIFQ